MNAKSSTLLRYVSALKSFVERGGIAFCVSYALHSTFVLIDLSGSVPKSVRPLFAVIDLLKTPPDYIASVIFHSGATISALVESWLCSLMFYSVVIWTIVEMLIASRKWLSPSNRSIGSDFGA
jgi:hypothetical protein